MYVKNFLKASFRAFEGTISYSVSMLSLVFFPPLPLSVLSICHANSQIYETMWTSSFKLSLHNVLLCIKGKKCSDLNHKSDVCRCQNPASAVFFVMWDNKSSTVSEVDEVSFDSHPVFLLSSTGNKARTSKMTFVMFKLSFAVTQMAYNGAEVRQKVWSLRWQKVGDMGESVSF